MILWQFVLHQHALEEIDHLRPASAAAFARCYYDWSMIRGNGLMEIRPLNDRVYLLKHVGSVRVIYWLDAFVRRAN